MSQMDEFLSIFRLEPSHTEADRATSTAHVLPTVLLSTTESQDITAGVDFAGETTTATHAQVVNTYQENMINYTHPQHGYSSGPGVPFHSPARSDVDNISSQWYPPPNAVQHHGQPAPILSVASSSAPNNYAQPYAGPSTALGYRQEQQQQRSAEVIMPGGFKFVIPVEVATVLMMSSHHRCGTCGSSV